jgi:hypothetical protein
MSTTARHGSEKFRVQSYPDSCHRGLKYIAFVLLMQRPPVLTIESMIAAVKVNVAKLMPTVAKQTQLIIINELEVAWYFVAGAILTRYVTKCHLFASPFRQMTLTRRRTHP